MTTPILDPDFKTLVPDGAILRITDNHTAHYFAMDTIVICCNQLPHGNKNTRYAYVVCSPTPERPYPAAQYISSLCGIVIGQGFVKEDMDLKDYYVSLEDYKTCPTTQTNLTALIPLNSKLAKTQKARGLQVLSKLGFIKTPMYFLVNPITSLPRLQFPLMARPCPVKPRHGFVESRIVNTAEETNAVLTETKAQDPLGEVVLMERFESAYSAVVTDSAVTMGPGTDGATAGKKSITIPCQSNLRTTILNKNKYVYCRHETRGIVQLRVLPYAQVKPEHNVFIETVGPHIVQLRTGPQADYSKSRFSTCNTVIIKRIMVLKAGMSFLQFEHMLQTYAKDGDTHCTILHLPNGSLSSHYAVQAIAKGFSVITEPAKLAIGQALNFSNTQTKLPVTSELRHAIVRGCEIGIDTTPTKDTVTWAIAVIQGLAATSHNVHSIALLTAASIILARAGTAICLGEHRHFYRRGPGLLGLLPSGPIRLKLMRKAPMDGIPDTPERDTIYHHAFALKWNRIPTWYRISSYLQGTKHDFDTDYWRGGYGGPKWAECTQASLDLLHSVIPLILVTPLQPNPNERGLLALHNQIYTCIANANRLITISHNSAKCLTKLVPSLILHEISQGNTGLKIATSPLTWELVQ